MGDGIDVVDTLITLDSLRRSDGVCDHGSMPVDRTPELPSVRVENAVRARIVAGEWQADERLPSVAALSAEYGVARATVVTALRRLEADGLVQIVSNWGTFRTDQAWPPRLRRDADMRPHALARLARGGVPVPGVGQGTDHREATAGLGVVLYGLHDRRARGLIPDL